MFTQRALLKYQIIEIIKRELKSLHLIDCHERSLSRRWRQLEIASRITNRILELEYFDDLRVE